MEPTKYSALPDDCGPETLRVIVEEDARLRDQFEAIRVQEERMFDAAVQLVMAGLDLHDVTDTLHRQFHRLSERLPQALRPRPSIIDDEDIPF